MGRIEDMQLFVRVVDAGSISAAADQLGVAKSGVSRRLAALERRLGVRLLSRTTRRSSLTEAGRTYYRGATQLIGNVEELETLTSGSDAPLEGPLRVAVPLSFGLGHLTPAIADFVDLHPGVRFQLDFSDRLVDLVGQGIDIAVRIADLADSSLQARRLCPIRLVWCASPGYLARHGTPRRPGDLADHRILHYDIGAGPSMRLLADDGAEHPVTVQPWMIANNGDFLLDLAISGHGLNLSPTFIARPALDAGALTTVLDDYHSPPLNAWAVYPRNRYLPPRARAFIDFLAERFGDVPPWDRSAGA